MQFSYKIQCSLKKEMKEQPMQLQYRAVILQKNDVHGSNFICQEQLNVATIDLIII